MTQRRKATAGAEKTPAVNPSAAIPLFGMEEDEEGREST